MYTRRRSRCGSTVFIVKHEELPNMAFKIYIETVNHTCYFRLNFVRNKIITIIKNKKPRKLVFNHYALSRLNKIPNSR